MTRLAVAAALALAAYATLLGLLWWRQEALIFRPAALPADHRFALAADVHETWVEVGDARLNALHLRLPRPDGVVFYLHGNASNLQGWFVNPEPYRRANLDLFMIDYRGYGKSSGRIESQAQLIDDVRAAWNSIAPRYAGQRRVVLGRSLGSGLAATLAAEVQPEVTVLVSPYTSLRSLAAEKFPWVPAAVLRYPLQTEQALAQVRGRVLLVHGEFDALIPVAHSRRLAQRVPGARLVVVGGAQHNDLQGFAAYQDALAQAFGP